MDIVTLEETLEKESLKLGINLITVATKFLEEYLNYFSRARINKINFSSNIAKLDLTKNQNLTVLEKRLISYNKVFKLSYNTQNYLIISLNDEVNELVINSKPKKLIYHFSIYDLIDNIKEEYGLRFNIEIYNQYKEVLYVKSLIYNYVYLTMLKNANKEYDYIIAGMFKNAYFDIISIYENTLDKKKAL